MRHDIHIISCRCAITEFTLLAGCEYVHDILSQTESDHCDQCGSVLAVRALQLVSSSPEGDLDAEVIHYLASPPMPVKLWLAMQGTKN